MISKAKRKYELIIFDCDGTLVDSEYLNNKAFTDILLEYGMPQYDVDYALKNFVGMTLTDIMQFVTGETGFCFPEDTLTKYISNVKKFQKTDLLKTIPRAIEIVKSCSSKFKVCVGSNGERSNVLESLKILGFMDIFSEETVFTRIQVEKGKPAPDLFLYAAEKMKIAPENCLVIEDSATGVRAGIAAGMDVWGFTGVSHDAENQKKQLLNAGASDVFSDIIHIGNKLEL